MTHSVGTLYLVATPIGNLADITSRAVVVLGEADFIICEDTRHSGILLNHLGIKKPLRSFHDHSSQTKVHSLVEELKRGARAAFITDAGTPLISDPGFTLVREAIKEGIQIEGIPGPSALINALVLSGLPTHSFTFVGYLSQKEKARRDALTALANEPRTLIFYESPHRIVKALRDMLEILGDREASVSREMTKKFEETLRGKLSELLEQTEKKKSLGEYVICVTGKEDE